MLCYIAGTNKKYVRKDFVATQFDRGAGTADVTQGIVGNNSSGH